MDIRKLQRAIVDGLEDVKAQNIVVFNTEHLSPLFERVIIASGTSNRQTKALAASVRDAVKARGLQVLRTEGEDNGEWIIVDCGAAVVHIMQPAIREYYHLEEIWGGKPVKHEARRRARAPAGQGLAKSRRTRPQAAVCGAPAKAPAKTAASRSQGAGQEARRPRRAGEEAAASRAAKAPAAKAAPAAPVRKRGGGQAGRAQGRRRARRPRRDSAPRPRRKPRQTRAMKLLVVAVGQRQPAWADAAWDDFAKRFPPELRLELKAVKAEPRSAARPPRSAWRPRRSASRRRCPRARAAWCSTSAARALTTAAAGRAPARLAAATAATWPC